MLRYVLNSLYVFPKIVFNDAQRELVTSSSGYPRWDRWIEEKDLSGDWWFIWSHPSRKGWREWVVLRTKNRVTVYSFQKITNIWSARVMILRDPEWWVSFSVPYMHAFFRDTFVPFVIRNDVKVYNFYKHDLWSLFSYRLSRGSASHSTSSLHSTVAAYLKWEDRLVIMTVKMNNHHEESWWNNTTFLY